MPEVICNTSPLQYLYQLGMLHLLPTLVKQVVVPPAVVDELNAGRASGVSLPDIAELEWVSVRHPTSEAALPLVTDLGPGETQVLMLGLDSPDAVIILDDGLARRIAESLGLHFTGILGLLLDAKRAGLIPAVSPLIDQLQQLRFRLAPNTRATLLKMAGEGE